MDSQAVGLGALRPGDHLCHPYESTEEKRSTLVTFIGEGLARRERCLFIGTPADQGELLATLEGAGVPAQRALEGGALILATQGETYLRTGRFDADDMLGLIDGMIDRALDEGFTGLRGTGEASTTVPDELWPKILGYEALVNERFARRPFVALCRFQACDIPPARAQDVLRTHPLVFVRGDLCGNPFYERSELAFSGDDRSRLAWQIHQLRTHARSRRRLAAAARHVHAEACEMARLAGRPAPSGPQEANLVTLVREIVDRHRAMLGDAACEVSFDLPEGDLPEGELLPSLTDDWDRNALERLVSTLLFGAAARGAGRAVTISVRADDHRARLTLHEGHVDAGYTVELPRGAQRSR